MNENKSVFVLDTQPIDGRKERKTHAQDVIREELNTVNAKIVSYGKLKSTVGLSIFHAWENFTSYFTLSRPSSFMTILCKSPRERFKIPGEITKITPILLYYDPFIFLF